ncbi:MAG TPA: metalloregulator ArsR/SmtB family transcription factor [Bacillota bacterium]|nr:metalloregulator ArsR/SmtB family transcription factor [Bacillota bacterium]
MEKLLNTFKVLSDETRIRILVMLYHKKLCVCELCGVLEESQPKISKHLAKLRDMGYVKDERQEQFIFYCLNNNDEVLKAVLQDIVENIASYPLLEEDLKRLDDAEKFFEVCKTR